MARPNQPNLTFTNRGFTVGTTFTMPTFTKAEVGMSSSADALVTVTEAAAAVKVSPQLVNWWRTTGRLEATRIDGIWRYRLGDVWEVERDMRHSPFSSRRRASTAA